MDCDRLVASSKSRPRICNAVTNDAISLSFSVPSTTPFTISKTSSLSSFLPSSLFLINCNDLGNAEISTSIFCGVLPSNCLTSSLIPICPFFTVLVDMFTIAVISFFALSDTRPDAVTPISPASELFKNTIGLPPDSIPKTSTSRCTDN